MLLLERQLETQTPFPAPGGPKSLAALRRGLFGLLLDRAALRGRLGHLEREN